MKKVLIISFLIFIILTSLLCTSYAAINHTEILDQAANEYAKQTEQVSQTLQNYDEMMANINASISKSDKNSDSKPHKIYRSETSTSKLPQTGDFFEIKDSLYILCIISSISLIAIALKSIKYRNIENNIIKI